MARILCVDDDHAVATVLTHVLKRLGHSPIVASDIDTAFRTLVKTKIDLVVSDFRMPGGSGLDLLRKMHEESLTVPVIMMTGYSSVEHAVEAIKSGAVDYLTKPLQPETLELAVNQALEVSELRQENVRIRTEISSLRSTRSIVGNSSALRQVMETIQAIAQSPATVLLRGESGTGKELFARAIHDQSPRHDKPFISINCAAMPEGLVESTLFGHEKGAFTGATEASAGAFERADGGTLLLDEITEMRLDLQAKLLRVIQEREFERVGGRRTQRVDVRLIATSNRPLEDEVAEGRFREDLFYRLAVVPIEAPPLRERREDIPALVRHMVERVCRESGTELKSVTDESLQLLSSYSWPGNVRQLANTVERAVLLSKSSALGPEAFGPLPSTDASSPAVHAANDVIFTARTLNLAEVERVAIDRALEVTGGNRTKAAQLLGCTDRTLRNKLNT